MRQPTADAIALALELVQNRNVDLDDPRWGKGLRCLCHEAQTLAPAECQRGGLAAEWDDNTVVGKEVWRVPLEVAMIDLKRR